MNDQRHCLLYHIFGVPDIFNSTGATGSKSYLSDVKRGRVLKSSTTSTSNADYQGLRPVT